MSGGKMNMILINVCILTYQRRTLLENCLESFRGLKVPTDTEVIVTVVDNDEAESARDTVCKFQSVLPLRMEYLCEPVRGIPVARNSAVDFCHAIGADYIAFIDDDEWVSEDWLTNAYQYCQSEGGDIVVSGEVVSVFPENCPEHIQAALQRKPRATGKELNSCATNNVLFPIHLTKELGLRFDTRNPLAGGTDTKFFAEAKSKGVKVVKCAESVVYEKVPESRTSMWWISKRKFRTGITECWRKRRNGSSSLGIFFSCIYHIIVKLLATIIMTLINNKGRRNRSWFKVCKSAGVLSGLFGLEVDSYKVIDS